jgi:hypothetical protein
MTPSASFGWQGSPSPGEALQAERARSESNGKDRSREDKGATLRDQGQIERCRREGGH